ncbi:hypothetical protein, partial [Desulfocicer niacini]
RNGYHIGEVALNKRNNAPKKTLTGKRPIIRPMETVKLILPMKEQQFLMAENGPPKKSVGGHEKVLRASR